MATQENQRDAVPDLHHYWRILKKRVWILLGVTASVAALCTVLTVRRPKIYQATATVIIDSQAPKVLGNESVDVVQLGSGSGWSDTDYYNTQVRILTSWSLARDVVLKHNLQARPELVTRKPGESDTGLIDDAVSILRDRIQITPIRDSHVFAISVRGTDGAFAAEVANYVAYVYIDQNLTVKQDATTKARKSVNALLDNAQHDLDEKETKLYTYKKEKNILSLSLEDQKNKISKALDTFSGALTETKRKRIDLQTRRKAIGALVKNDLAQAPSSFVVDSPGIDKLRDTYLDEERKLMGLQERYGEKHPEVIVQQARVDTALAGLKQAGDSMLKSLDAEIAALQDSEARFTNEVADLTQEAFELSKQEIEYKRFSRDAVNAEQVYTQLLKRLNENQAQEQDRANNIRMLDEARLPLWPVEPNLKLAVLFGFGLGLALALALAFGIEYLDRTVKNQEDLEALLGAPFLGMIPSVDAVPANGRGGVPEMQIIKQPNSSLAECCRVVRTNILFCSPDKPLKTIMVTSASSSEGKTLSVLHLGIVMAQSGHRTLLVDTDMRRPRLHKAMGTSNERGVSGLIVGDGDLQAAVKTTDVPNLFLLPCGPIPPNPAELLQTEKFAALVAMLATKFDRVIFDSPPLLAVTDAAILSRAVDGTVMVVRAGRTNRDAVARAHQAMTNVNANVIGVVLNDVNLKSPHYAYYYGYYHGYQSPEAPAPVVPGQPTGG